MQRQRFWIALPLFASAFLGASLSAAPAAASATASIPVAFPLSRYQAMVDKSPFAVGTPPPPPPEATAPPAPSFAQDLCIIGIAKLGSQDFVTIGSRDKTQRFSLCVGESGPDGIILSSVTHDPGRGKSKAMLKKGTEFAAIGFDEAAQNNTPAEGAPQPVPAPNLARPARNLPQQPAVAPVLPNRNVVPNVRPFRPPTVPGQNPAAPNAPMGRVRRPPIPTPR
jgi:hypothetical protein